MSFLGHTVNFQGVVDIFMHDPAGYLPFTQLMAEIMSGESTLHVPQREMIALYVSTLNNCHYCCGSHRAVLANLQIDDAVIAAVEAGKSADASTQAALDFAKKLTRSPGAVAKNDIENMQKAGWSDQGIEDVIKVVSLFSFLNRLVDGMGIYGNAQVFAQAGTMIAEHGYYPVVQMVQGKAV
ncbi:MAG: peroxidase-related enzyme [Robiginitomaculum sp.]|nr:peroxidase-related enzyme [Robiginitomaculum sp.]MDQ7078168.1 peroxidase-related enzyme [Robiginitomaculum sp.]